jgi:hypothetical protein
MAAETLLRVLRNAARVPRAKPRTFLAKVVGRRYGESVKPNDENGRLPVSERPFRVLLIAGSNRRQYNCPGVDGKARTLMFRMADRLPQAWEIDLEDLGNVYAREHVQSCNACVSTSMALCCWPCNCYERGHRVREK